MSREGTRRRFLTATAAALGAVGLASTTGADDHRSFVLEQDGDCYPVVPLSGDETVEAFYRWGKSIGSYSSNGTRYLQEPESSLLFLYRGPERLSLVIVHDALDDGTPGGKASFEIQGIPGDASWVVKDDLYDSPSNVDTWEVNGTVLNATEDTVTDGYYESDDDETESDDNESAATGTETAGTRNETAETTRTDRIDWWWTTSGTDGGALRGLAVDDLELRIEPAFNEASELRETPEDGEVTSWELLSGDREEPDRTELDLGEPVTLRTGSCGGDASTPDDATATAATGNETEGEADANGEDGDDADANGDDGDDAEEDGSE